MRRAGHDQPDGRERARRYVAFLERNRLVLTLVIWLMLQPTVLIATRALVPSLIFGVGVLIAVWLGLGFGIRGTRRMLSNGS
jgi:hypothetical protein